jgi:hypothetical protein
MCLRSWAVAVMSIIDFPFEAYTSCDVEISASLSFVFPVVLFVTLC